MRPVSLANRIATALVGLASGLAAGTSAADVVVVVSASNPVAALTRNQAVDIFLGKSSRFPDGNPAVPIDQAEGAAARDEFYLSFAGKSAAQVNAHWSKMIFTGRGRPPREVANDAEVKKRLADNPNAIGYLDQSQVDASVKVLVSK
jgi:ABC-type phosphate transport system substrate-binding protein